MTIICPCVKTTLISVDFHVIINKKEEIPTEQSIQKSRRLLTAVRDMVLENGIQGASMSKISKAANVPMGTIYTMFPTKDDLINATYIL